MTRDRVTGWLFADSKEQGLLDSVNFKLKFKLKSRAPLDEKTLNYTYAQPAFLTCRRQRESAERINSFAACY